MKIFKENEVFVQKNDIAFLNNTSLDIPASIYLKVFGSGVTIIDGHDRYDFVKFDLDNEIDFFKEMDFIVDYDEYKNLSEESIIEIAKNIDKRREQIAAKYNGMSGQDRLMNQHLVCEVECLDFQIGSILDILWLRQGNFNLKLPKGIEIIPIKKDEAKTKSFL